MSQGDSEGRQDEAENRQTATAGGSLRHAVLPPDLLRTGRDAEEVVHLKGNGGAAYQGQISASKQAKWWQS